MTDPDVAAGLSELERKLEALEQELQGSRRAVPAGAAANGGDHAMSALRISTGSSPSPVTLAAVTQAREPDRSEPWSGAPRPDEPSREPHTSVSTPPAASGAPAPPQPAAPADPVPAGPVDDVTRLVADARDELGGLHAHLDELERFREQLERSAQELIGEYDRLLTGLRAVAEREQAAPAASTGLDGVILDGMLTVDAGPFEDIASLAELEQALDGLPGVRDVHVRTFERSHALIDVILGEPIAFGSMLRRSSALTFSITRAVPGQVTVALG